MGNLSLGMQFRTCEKNAESALDSANLSPLISLNYSSQKGCTPHPAPPTRQKLSLFAFRGRASLSPLLAKNRRLHFCNLESDFLHHEAGEIKGASHGFILDSAESQNLIKNFCHSERSEESKNNPSLRVNPQDLRGNPPCEKTQNLQNGLPRSHSLARNDDSFRDSAILQNKFFPTKKSLRFAESRGQFLPNTALIALGANLKNPIATFKSLFTKLTRNAKIHILSTSPIYKNPPFGYANQPFFYNATILLATKMCLLEFYAFIFYLERIFGRNRKRAFKNAPRTLDIDIIFFNDIFMRSKKLNIPHPQWQTRASVLVPLIFQVHYKGF